MAVYSVATSTGTSSSSQESGFVNRQRQAARLSRKKRKKIGAENWSEPWLDYPPSPARESHPVC